MTTSKKFCDLTKHPKLFKKCYWGNFECSDRVLRSQQTTGANRDDFVSTYEVTAYVDNYLTYASFFEELFDHSELYKCKKGYVLIVSPYSIEDEVAASLGFMSIPSVYADNARTYARTFDNKREYNKFAKSVYPEFRP